MTRTQLFRTALLLAIGVVTGCGPAKQGAAPEIAQITFDITVPQDTPEQADVYIIGTHPNLGNDSDDSGLKLRRGAATTFSGAVYLPKDSTVYYRVRMKNPNAAELDASEQMVAPRRLNVGGDATEAVTVARWAVPRETIRPVVTFVVNVPANTPTDAEVYIAGNQPELGPWEPKFFKLDKVGDRKYSRSVKFAADPGTVLKFKATRGSWSTVEKDAGGGEIQDREFVIPSMEAATVEITVASWAT